jgi:hypothetical protein
MSLIDACADFTEAVDRSDVAAACLSLIEIAATSVKEHVPENAGPSLIRAIVIARARSVEEAVRGGQGESLVPLYTRESVSLSLCAASACGPRVNLWC